MLVVALLTVVFPKLSLFVTVLLIISAAALPKLTPQTKRLALSAHIASGLLIAYGLFQFVTLDAVPGVIRGGGKAAGKLAVSKLRGLLVAQDTLRRFGRIDPDQDGIGSAALLSELAGSVNLRHQQEPLEAPLLSSELKQLVSTPLGPAASGGAYLYILCLPTPNGGWTAQPGEPVDDEAAERSWVGYAWPIEEARGFQEAYFIDQHERILVFENTAHEYSGANQPPACDAALANPKAWQPWQGKEPRSHLPGDSSSAK